MWIRRRETVKGGSILVLYPTPTLQVVNPKDHFQYLNMQLGDVRTGGKISVRNSPPYQDIPLARRGSRCRTPAPGSILKIASRRAAFPPAPTKIQAEYLKTALPPMVREGSHAVVE